MTLSNARDEVFHAEVVNVFQPFNIFAKRSAIADGHNPGHASDIFLRFLLQYSLIVQSRLIKFLELDVYEDLIFSYGFDTLMIISWRLNL